MVEVKAEAGKREFERVAPHYTSQDCPRCHYRQKKALSQRTHRCTNCGLIAPRDIVSSICIKAKASFARRYPTLMGEFKSLKKIQSILMQEKSTSVESGCDAATISPVRGKKCADDQVCGKQTARNGSKKLDVQRLQGVLPLGEYRAPDREMNTAISTKKRRRKFEKSTSTAQMGYQTQLQLDFGEGQ